MVHFNASKSPSEYVMFRGQIHIFSLALFLPRIVPELQFGRIATHVRSPISKFNESTHEIKRVLWQLAHEINMISPGLSISIPRWRMDNTERIIGRGRDGLTSNDTCR
jgi:hypothetical protein